MNFKISEPLQRFQILTFYSVKMETRGVGTTLINLSTALQEMQINTTAFVYHSQSNLLMPTKVDKNFTYNSQEHHHYLSQKYYAVITVNAVMLGILSFSSAILNSSLIAAFFATKQAAINSSNILIVSISIADFLASIIGMPFYLHSLYKPLLKGLAITITVAFYPVSETFTMLLAMDRYMHMNPNMNKESKLRKIFTKPYLYVVLFLGFTQPSCGAVIIYHWPWPRSLFSIGLQCLVGNSFNIFAITFIAGMYVKGYARVRRFADDNPVYRNENGTANRPEYVSKLFKSVLILTVAMFFAYLPVTVLNIALGIIMIQGEPPPVQLTMWMDIAYVCIFANCSLNCMVVFHHNDVARQWIKGKILAKCLGSREDIYSQSDRNTSERGISGRI